MSSLRNAVKRITHKERSQPVSRQHLGILEKKKDYRKRADDYHRKEDRIKAMREKAAMRNPDEFYFGMNSTQLKDGKHVTNTESRDLPADLIRLMKDQDLSYFHMQKQKDAKKAERLQASLHLIEGQSAASTKKSKAKHTIFVETKEEVENFDKAEYFDTVPEFADRTFNRRRKADILKEALQEQGVMRGGVERDDALPTAKDLKEQERLEKRQARKLARARESSYREMEARKSRAQAMEQAAAHLMLEKNLAAKGRKRKIKAAENGQPAQYKWRRKRLR